MLSLNKLGYIYMLRVGFIRILSLIKVKKTLSLCPKSNFVLKNDNQNENKKKTEEKKQH